MSGQADVVGIDARKRREAELENRARKQIARMVAGAASLQGAAAGPPTCAAAGEDTFVCVACKGSITGPDYVEKIPRAGTWFKNTYFATAKPIRFHPACWESHLAEAAAEDVAKRRASLDDRFERAISREGTFFPRWPFARFSNAEFRSRVSPALLPAFENYRPKEDGNLFVLGPTGDGKTSLSVAHVWDSIERAKAETVPGKTGAMLDFAFITAPELVQSRRQTRLGSGAEAKLVRLAMDVELLILDEVGFELESEVVFDVMDHRLRALRPTILTTGQRQKEFRKRYGDALWRRVAEQGALFEDWEPDVG